MNFPTKLLRYLEKKNISDSAFGRSIYKTPAMIGRYKRGLSVPGFQTALMIYQVTEGYFSMKEMGYDI